MLRSHELAHGENSGLGVGKPWVPLTSVLTEGGVFKATTSSFPLQGCSWEQRPAPICWHRGATFKTYLLFKAMAHKGERTPCTGPTFSFRPQLGHISVTCSCPEFRLRGSITRQSNQRLTLCPAAPTTNPSPPDSAPTNSLLRKG